MKLKNLIYLLLIIAFSNCSEKKISADILIINGAVYTGIDSIARNWAVATKDDQIVFVGDLNDVAISAKRTIDANGLVVSPGFIDPHTHADRDLKDSTAAHNSPFLFQGITTVVAGNDGDSFYPTSEYTARYKSHGIGTNVALLVGHGTVRAQVMGSSDQRATEEEIAKMQELVQQEMDAGAFGMSTGLFYAPGSYSNTDEVVALAKTVSENNGIYDTHLRDESSYTVGLIPAIKEAIEIGERAALPIHISHIKCLGVDVWRQSDSIVALIEEARAQGLQITANQYPYDASATGLKAAVAPRWAESGGKDSLFVRYKNPIHQQRILAETKSNIARRGGPEKLLVVKAADSNFVNKDLLEISKALGLSPEKAVFEILEKGYVRVASFNMNAYDIENFMQRDWVVTGSDGNTGHPRKYGSFPRKYHKYVEKDGIITIAEFIKNSTSKTAEILKIPQRGTLKEGFFADLIIFNPSSFKDIANYKDAFQLSEGLEYSIINGKLAVDQGKFTGARYGRVLKKQ